jgi:AcrR family transcriptional regulator
MTVERICAEAGVDEEDFAAEFADEQACLEHVWEEMTGDYIRTCRGAYSAEQTWRDGLRAAGYAALRWFWTDEARSRFFLIEVMSGGEMVRARRDLMMNDFIDMLDAGRQELDDPDSCDRGTAECMTGAIYNNAIEAVRRRETYEEACERVRAIMHIAVLPYCGPEAAREELELPPPAGSPNAT